MYVYAMYFPITIISMLKEKNPNMHWTREYFDCCYSEISRGKIQISKQKLNYVITQRRIMLITYSVLTHSLKVTGRKEQGGLMNEICNLLERNV